ncbi:hypothetical protein SAMN05877809_10913 [Rhodobacter sp. JA431]|uniref:hypothetical protein n=1 Tax=Rhodobacter sp. JA431 TaxID=570013 RepID=UPI000BD5F648|nr:hypothetical protein [Rhodobacter sp. JA431]SOC16868.1 hypothetical protein SAMN05877809_10913 [Rhodobacter sp. JA431]
MAKRRTTRILTFADAVNIQTLIIQGEMQHSIAALYGVNQGRISEINTEKRHRGSRVEALRRLHA